MTLRGTLVLFKYGQRIRVDRWTGLIIDIVPHLDQSPSYLIAWDDGYSECYMEQESLMEL